MCYNQAMLDLKYIQENFEEVKKRIATRGQPQALADLDELYHLSDELRRQVQRVQALREKRNRISEEVKKLKPQGKDVSALIEESRKVGEEISALEKESRELEEQLNSLLLRIPNLPHESVPLGKSLRRQRGGQVGGGAARF